MRVFIPPAFSVPVQLLKTGRNKKPSDWFWYSTDVVGYGAGFSPLNLKDEIDKYERNINGK